MSNVTIKPEQLQSVLTKALAEYGDEVFETTKMAAKEAGRRTSKEIKATAPVKTGSYARGWSHKEHKSTSVWYTDAVYNRTDGQLTHLLEKPHATGYGKGYPANVDYTGRIAKIEEQEVQKFFNEVVAKL